MDRDTLVIKVVTPFLFAMMAGSMILGAIVTGLRLLGWIR